MNVAISQTANSSTAATASAPSVHGARMRMGLLRQRTSAWRVSAQPWTSASSSAFTLMIIGISAEAISLRVPWPT